LRNTNQKPPRRVYLTYCPSSVKKPAPAAYLVVLKALGLATRACLAFEHSLNGLAAAWAAGLVTIVTPSLCTIHETFEGAALVLPDLGGFDLEAQRFRLADKRA